MFTKVMTFLEGRFLSSESEQFKKLSQKSNWLEKVGPLKRFQTKKFNV